MGSVPDLPPFHLGARLRALHVGLVGVHVRVMCVYWVRGGLSKTPSKGSIPGISSSLLVYGDDFSVLYTPAALGAWLLHQASVSRFWKLVPCIQRILNYYLKRVLGKSRCELKVLQWQ